MNNLLRAAACSISGALLLSSVTIAQPLEKEKREVREDIRILNLVNNIYLTEKQMRHLLSKAREAEGKRKTFSAQLEELTNYNEPSLKEMRHRLLKGEELPQYLTRRVGATQKKLRDLRDKYEKEMLGLARGVTRILNENQVVMVDRYKPCVVPYRDLTHPERVGQADASGAIERLLERVHRLPAPVYEKRKEGILMVVSTRLEKHTHKEINLEKEKRCLAKIFGKARALSDLEFELKKTELAREVLPEENKEKTEKQKLKKLARFFLSPRIIPILEEKLSREK